jgi:hypothetical protein
MLVQLAELQEQRCQGCGVSHSVPERVDPVSKAALHVIEAGNAEGGSNQILGQAEVAVVPDVLIRLGLQRQRVR